MKIKIEKQDYFGKGIGYMDKKVVFVPKTLPNEEVDIEITKESKKYYDATLNKIIKPSVKRFPSVCPYFAKCGGCHLRMLSYDDTLEYKENKLKDIFKREIDMIPSHDNYRNKITLKVINGKVGYFEEKTHSLLEIECCPNANVAINEIIPKIKMTNIKNGEVLIRSNYNSEILLSFTTLDKLNFDVFENDKIVGIIQNDKVIVGNNHFIEIINNLFFKVSINSFFQVNSDINSKLFTLLEKYISKDKTVLDLYCGVGTLGISIAKNSKKVIGIDNSESNIMDALINSKMNNLNNVNFMLGDASKSINKITDKIDVIVVDPPRSGLNKEGIKNILSVMPDEIVYISCNSMTLVRDLKLLEDKYEIIELNGLDMFPYTYHVECVVLLGLRKNEKKLVKQGGLQIS